MTTIMDTPMTDHQHHLLLTLFSPAFPVGSFAYSHGLERAVATGEVEDAADLEAWLRDVLRFGAGRTDAILVALAHGGADVAELAESLATSRERHLETMAQGRAFAQAASQALGVSANPAAYPVVVGRVTADLGLPLAPVLSAYLHAFTSNIVSAGVRFVPLGQAAGQRVLAALFKDMDAVAQEAANAGPDDIGSISVLSDIAAIEHETMDVRIFRT